MTVGKGQGISSFLIDELGSYDYQILVAFVLLRDVSGEYLRTSGALEMYDVITGWPTQWFDLKLLGWHLSRCAVV